MRSLSEEGVIYLGSFSKTFAPGLRVGWVSPRTPYERNCPGLESAVLCPSAFTQLIVSELPLHARLAGQIEIFRGLYRERRDALLDALAEFLPGRPWTVPDGGSTCGSPSPTAWTPRPCCLGPVRQRRLYPGHRLLRRRHGHR